MTNSHWFLFDFLVGVDISCGRSRCMNQTTVALNGTTQYKFGCATERDYDSKSPVKDECQEVRVLTYLHYLLLAGLSVGG